MDETEGGKHRDGSRPGDAWSECDPPSFSGGDATGPTVLPLPTLFAGFLDRNALATLNVIQLEYAHQVAAAQAKAYKKLLDIVNPSGVHTTYPPD